MDFAPHIRTIFTTRGAASVYTPAVGTPISCKAIRQGGGQPVRIGPVLVTTERISFHVRRADIAAPVAGSVLTYRDETFTVDAVQPVERDAEGLLWSLEASWGADLIYRSVTGSGSMQNPPQGSGFVVSAEGLAGANVISINAPLAVGKLFAGDKIGVGSHTYTVTGAGVQAVMNQFSAVPISPALAATVSVGDPVTMSFSRDRALRGAVATYAANEFLGGVQAGDRRIVIMQAAMAGLDAPKAGDRIVFEGRSFNVISASAIYQGQNPVAWDIQVRG
jgi:hypothetical protein